MIPPLMSQPPRRKPTGPKPIKLPEMLDTWMIRNSVSNRALAEHLGLATKNGWRSVSRWRNKDEDGYPDRAHEIEIARLLGVAVEDFYVPGTFEDPVQTNETRDSLDHIETVVDRIEAVVKEVRVLLTADGVTPEAAQALEELRAVAEEGRRRRREQNGRSEVGGASQD